MVIPWSLTDDLWLEVAGIYEHCELLVLQNMIHIIVDALNNRTARPWRKKTSKNIMANVQEEYYDVLRSMEGKF